MVIWYTYGKNFFLSELYTKRGTSKAPMILKICSLKNIPKNRPDLLKTSVF
jgi:hypothetical protein